MGERTDAATDHPAVRRLALTGVVGPVLAVLLFTVVGALRPGYSPVRKAISALGTGPDGWPLDAVGVAMGVGLIVFAAVFATLMRPVLRPGARWFATACFALDGLGAATAGVFTASPGTVAVHTVGASVGTVGTVVAFAVVGVALRRNARWRRWGTYSLAAAVVSLVLVVVEYAFLMPRSPLHGLQVGGLLERMDFCWHYAWYVAFGWRLFRGERGPRVVGLPPVRPEETPAT